MGLDVNFANLLAAENNVGRGKVAGDVPLAPDQDSVDAFREKMGDGAQPEEAGLGQSLKHDSTQRRTSHERPGESSGSEPGKIMDEAAGETMDDAQDALSRRNESQPSADAMLESLFGNRMMNAGQQNMDMTQTKAAQGVSDSASLRTAELVDKLVDRILVSEPSKNGTEVRLSISDKMLPGTEISITKALDGQLTVKIQSSDPVSFQTLVAAQNSLRSALERQGDHVRVDVNMSGETDAQENDSRRQSRGYQAYQSDEDDK